MSWAKKFTEFDIDFPTFTMAGPYKASGRFLLLPMTGSGPSNFTFSKFNDSLPLLVGWSTVSPSGSLTPSSSLKFRQLAANLKVHYSFHWPYKKAADGQEYATLTNSKIGIASAEHLSSDLQGLFNGDRLLGKTQRRGNGDTRPFNERAY